MATTKKLTAMIDLLEQRGYALDPAFRAALAHPTQVPAELEYGHESGRCVIIRKNGTWDHGLPAGPGMDYAYGEGREALLERLAQRTPAEEVEHERQFAAYRAQHTAERFAEKVQAFGNRLAEIQVRCAQELERLQARVAAGHTDMGNYDNLGVYTYAAQHIVHEFMWGSANAGLDDVVRTAAEADAAARKLQALTPPAPAENGPKPL